MVISHVFSDVRRRDDAIPHEIRVAPRWALRALLTAALPALTTSDTVTATISGFSGPTGIVLSRASATGWGANTTTVSVIDMGSNQITGTISGFQGASGLSGRQTRD